MSSSWLSAVFRVVGFLTRIFPGLGLVVNRFAINVAVEKLPNRPHPWSTVHDYVSWTSLSDQHYSARHLPAFHPTYALPDAESVTALFKRPDKQQLCPKSTCLFPAFAQYLTDGFIRTRMPNTSAREPESLRRQNTSNHQIDLCTLYGRTPDQTHVLRLLLNESGARGRLKSQLLKGEEYSPFLFDDDGGIKSEFYILDVPLGLDTVTDSKRKVLFATGGDRVNSAPQVAMMNTLSCANITA